MSHLTYAEAIVTGLVQGVSELFPISSLGHNVLIPALLGGQWAKDLDVTATKSPYLAFIVGLHVATALAMIVYFRRDWVRIIRGFFTSIRDREVIDPDQRLAWMVVLGTIPVGLVGLVLQKVVTGVFAKPLLTALFLAVNGGILLFSERQRRLEPAGPGGDWGFEDEPEFAGRAPRGPRGAPGRPRADGPRDPRDPRWDDGPRDPRRGGDPWMDGYPDDRGAPRGPGFQPGPVRPGPGQPGPGQPGPGQPGPGQPGPGQPGPGRGYNGPGDEERTQVWNQQPGQQQWQGPDPRYGDPRFGPDPRHDDPRFGPDPRFGADPRDPRYAQQPPAPGQGPSFTPAPPAPPAPPSAPPAPQYDPRPGAAPRYPQEGPGAPSFTPAAQPGQAPGAGEPRGPVRDERGSGRVPWEDRPAPADPWGPDGGWDRRDPRDDFGRPGRRRRPAPGDGFDDAYDEREGNVAADRRLATMTFKQAVLIGSWQIAALLPGISRDGIVTIGGMRKGLTREDAVRYSFLLSAPVILAAGVLKMGDLTGPETNGIMGPVIVGSLLSFAGAYFSVRFLTRYFSESKSLKPFGYYCLGFGLLAFVYLMFA